MRHNFDKFVFGLMLVMVAAILVILYLFVFEKGQVTFTNIPFPTDRVEYVTGETINFKARECSDKPVEYTYTQKFVNVDTGEASVVGSITRTSLGRCDFIKISPIPVGVQLSTGEYFILLEIVAEGQFRSFVYDTVRTATFRIDEKPIEERVKELVLVR